MKWRNILVRIAMFTLCCLTVAEIGDAADKIKIEVDPPQRLEVRYRLFQTDNIWTFLELDTQTGRLN
jgi:hypothetical protein